MVDIRFATHFTSLWDATPSGMDKILESKKGKISSGINELQPILCK